MLAFLTQLHVSEVDSIIDTEARRTKYNATRPLPLNRRVGGAASQEHWHENSDDDSNLNDIDSCGDSCGDNTASEARVTQHVVIDT